MTTSPCVSGSRPRARGRTKEVVFSGSSVRAYLEWRRRSGSAPADIVVLDLTLGDGTTVTENVTSSSPTARRCSSTASPIARGRARGARRRSRRRHQQGLRTDDVIAAIRTIARGEALDNVEWASAVDGDRAFADAQLSNRERDVLRLYAAGLPLKAVADRLGIAYSTAKENITRCA
jgi:DNA-binding NarL/FixJ family response regulator